MSEPEDAGKYQVNNDGPVQGQVIGDHPIVHQHFYTTQDKAPSPSKPPRVWNIPYLRNDYFTGREEILAQLHIRFQANNATALSQRTAMSGLGGIGKTQIAVQYAYEHSDEYQAVLWARAESHETLTSSFVEIAGLLVLPQKDEQDQTITVQAVKLWLQDNHEWLLILDNADEPAIVREFLPTKFDGHILLTTRAQALGGLAQRLEIDTFTPELGALFLLRRATIIAANAALDDAVQGDREGAMQISEELGGLPLALDQAGAYIEETGCHLAKYLERYQGQRTKLLKRRGSNSDNPASVATTWSLSFERVEQNAIAADLLRLCAFLAPDAIPEEMIIKGASYLGEHLQSVLEDEGLLDEAIGVLRAYSLIRRDTTEKMLSIHRLVQAVLQDDMSDEETKLWAERTVLAVNEACPVVEFKMWPQWERHLPHALVCADLVEQGNLVFIEAAFLLNNTGGYLKERARYTEAELLFLRALVIRVQLLGTDHPDTANSLNNLATLYQAQGKFEQAEPLLQRALAIHEQQLGPLHPDTAQSLNNLATLYDNQGQFEQAESLYQHALAIREQQLGSQHPNTANSLNNLAMLYQDLGKFEQAEPLLQRALAIREQQLGPLHPNTAQSLNNLAMLYQHLGKFELAKPLYQHALAIHEKALGPQHPDTAQSLSNLAAIYRTLGKHEQAEPLLQRALAIHEKALGPQHPDTANSLNNLAMLYQKQGKYAQSEPLLQRALAIYKKALGPQHPDIANSLNNLASLYDQQGKFEQAEPLYQRALTICEKALGPQHPDTAQSLNNLAVLYQKQGKYAQSEPLYQRALVIHEQQLGPDHPDMAGSLNNLASLYHHQGNYKQAEPLYQRALAICEQQLGPDHLDVATNLNNLAVLYQKQGKYKQAESLFKRAFAIYEKALGPQHPEAATNLNNLAVLYQDQGKFGQAEPLLKQALAIYETALGPQHPNTQLAQQNYAALLLSKERKAAQEYKNGPGSQRLHSDRQSGSVPRPTTSTKVGRNEPCPCGSGKKYKKCHGA